MEPLYQGVRGIGKIIEDSNGTIYFASSEGVLKLNDNLTTSLLRLPGLDNYLSLDITLGHNDSLWMATNKGLWVYEIDKEKFSTIPIFKRGDLSINNILFEKNGGLWMSMNNHLVHRLPNGKITDYNQVDFNYTNFLYKDRFGQSMDW